MKQYLFFVGFICAFYPFLHAMDCAQRGRGPVRRPKCHDKALGNALGEAFADQDFFKVISEIEDKKLLAAIGLTVYLYRGIFKESILDVRQRCYAIITERREKASKNKEDKEINPCRIL